MAFGKPLNVVYKFDRASRILSLDADFLLTMVGGVRYAHDYAAMRRVRKGTTETNRMYAIESTPTITGAMADHQAPVRPGDVYSIALAIASKLGIDTGGVSGSIRKVWGGNGCTPW